MPIASDGKGNYLTLDKSGEWVKATVAEDPRTGTKLINDGGEWKPEPGKEPSAIGSALRGVVQGVTFGFGDELRAGTDALVQGAGNLVMGSDGRPTMGQAYDRSLAASRAQIEADRSAHPIASTGGELTGAAGSAVLTPPLGAARVVAPIAARAAPWLNTIMPNLPSWLQTGARVAGTGTRLAAEGAVQGGVAGFGEGEGGAASRAGSAASGAGVGALVAPFAAGAVHAAPVVGGRIAETVGLRNPEKAADRQILRSLDRAGTNVDEVETRLAAGGNSPLALVDVGGRNTVNLGATAANTPSTSLDAADRFVQARREGRPERLMEGGDAAFGGGSGADIATATAERQAKRATEARPLYEAAFGKPAGMTEPMQAIITHPIGQSGLKQGLEIQGIENATRRARGEAEVPTHDPAIRYDENGDPRIVGVPNMRTLDAIKRGMDATLDAARSDVTGQIQWTERLHAVDDMRRTWVKLLDENNPDYAAARAAWGGPSAQMEATAAGRKALTSDRDVVAGRMQAPPDVQDAYRLGAGRQFSDMASDPARDVNLARKMSEDRNTQLRLKAMLDQPQLENLNTLLRRERDMGQVEQAVSPRAGSQTKRLLAGGEDMGRDPVGPLLTAAKVALSGAPMQGANMAWGEAYRRIGQGINASTANALADRLFATDPAARAQVIDALRNRLLTDEGRAAVLKRFIEPALTATQRTAGGYAGRRD